MTSYFIVNDWTRHNDIVYEAKDFVSKEDCKALMAYINNKNSQCVKHSHEYHTPNNDPDSDAFTWNPECIDGAGEAYAGGAASIHGISRIVHEMYDAANRYTMKDMKLAKIVVHKYKQGSSGPEHTDIFPLATLLYLNDDYQGGNIYFSETGLSIKPGAGSLLTFDGGGINRHGVDRVEKGDRYVIVAFWDYQVMDEQVRFWNIEAQSEDERNNSIQEAIDRKIAGIPRATILYPEIFPILKIDAFVERELSSSIIDYLNLNDLDADECWGPSCFPEYYEKAYGTKANPELVPGIEIDTLSKINDQIGIIVNKFMELEPGDLVFSKFKGHDHKEGSMSPPHTHYPADAVAHLVLWDDYEGGNINIPKYGIEFRADPGCLYVYSEENDLTHGISQITKGFRPSLISHWQSKFSRYDKAGANI